jgi:hypothetical protein
MRKRHYRDRDAGRTYMTLQKIDANIGVDTQTIRNWVSEQGRSTGPMKTSRTSRPATCKRLSEYAIGSAAPA